MRKHLLFKKIHFSIFSLLQESMWRRNNPKKHIITPWGFVFLMVLLLGYSHATAQTEHWNSQELMEQARFNFGAPGLSVAVAMNGRIVFSEGTGYANLELQTPATGATVYRIASISKPITAVGVMQLVEQGHIKLDDSIQHYVPSFPRKSKGTITLFNLLTHTSGIRHYNPEEFGVMEHFDTLEDAINIFKDDTLNFEPGANFSYTTYGFNLLQGVIETAGARSPGDRETPESTMSAPEKTEFGEYMRRNVWEPAGMVSTFLEYPQQLVRNRAQGYIQNEQGFILNARYTDVSIKFAGGGMISTVEDLVRLFIALDNGVLIKPETVKKMYSVYYQRENMRGQGLGWAVTTDGNGHLLVNHGGSSTGFRSILINYPQHKLIVAAIANCDWFSPESLAQEIADIYLAAVESHRH